MKGLLVKDILSLKNQRKMLLVCLGLGLLYIFLGLGDMAMGYLPFFLILLCTKLLINELTSKEMQFYFTLPFSRKQFVTEKYVYCIGFPVLILLLTGVLTWIFSASARSRIGMTMLAIVPALLVAVSILMPLILKFKDKASFVITICALLICAFFLVYFDEISVFSTASLPDFSWQVWMMIWWILGLAAAVVSWFVSCRIMDSMEF